MEFFDCRFNKYITWSKPKKNNIEFLEEISIFLLFKNLIDIYVSIRQIRLIRDTLEIPEKARGFIDKATFDNTRIYQVECEDFQICKALYRIITSFIEIHFKLSPKVWAQCVTYVLDNMPLGDECSDVRKQELLASFLFVSSMIVIHFTINLPVRIFETYILEQRYDFAKVSATNFIKDTGVSIFLAHIVIQPIVSGMVLISQHFKGHYIFLVWLLLATCFTIWYFILPPVINMVYNIYRLECSELFDSISQLVQKVNFPIDSVYVADSSSRTLHSNAFIFGFGKTKKIVLYDTLLKPRNSQVNINNRAVQLNEDKGLQNHEVLAVVAHELGHWHYNHVFVNLLLLQINFLFVVAIYSQWYNEASMYESFGFEKDSLPLVPGIYLVYFFIQIPYHALTGIVYNFASKVMEWQADEFATRLVPPSSLKSALIKLYKDNLDFPIRDILYDIWNCTHPSQLERLEAILMLENRCRC